jgi:polar amino acid transport system substrate-binding protein
MKMANKTETEYTGSWAVKAATIIMGLAVVAAGAAFFWNISKEMNRKPALSMTEAQVQEQAEINKLEADGLPANYMVTLQTENYPPFNMAEKGNGFRNYSSEAGISGMGTEIVQHIFKDAGIKYKMTLGYPWSKMYDETLAEPNYGLFVTTRTAARESSFKWVCPLGKTKIVLMVKGDSPIQKLSSIKDLDKYIVGTYKGDVVDQVLTEKGVTVQNSALDEGSNLQRLVNNQIEIWATSYPVGPYFAKTKGVTGLREVLQVGDESEVCLAFNLQTPDVVVSKLKAALDKSMQDGSYENIRAKYF